MIMIPVDWIQILKKSQIMTSIDKKMTKLGENMQISRANM